MSENKGKAKAKPIAKSAGKNKAAVMNTRNPKKPEAISGDTMSNYAMYKKGGRVKKYADGGSTPTSDRSIKLFGNTYDKTVSRTKNDDGTVTKNKVKTVSKDGVVSKKKELSRTTEDGYIINKDRTKTKYLGDGDTDVKKRSQNYPTNRKAYQEANYKKGGMTKAKKFAALAPPYNKITAADRIAGAKKNARKKK
jgi:hypothetical protein